MVSAYKNKWLQGWYLNSSKEQRRQEAWRDVTFKKKINLEMY
jgi:hypothetical protein